jgi:hypothetical protein
VFIFEIDSAVLKEALKLQHMGAIGTKRALKTPHPAILAHWCRDEYIPSMGANDLLNINPGRETGVLWAVLDSNRIPSTGANGLLKTKTPGAKPGLIVGGIGLE